MQGIRHCYIKRHICSWTTAHGIVTLQTDDWSSTRVPRGPIGANDDSKSHGISKRKVSQGDIDVLKHVAYKTTLEAQNSHRFTIMIQMLGAMHMLVAYCSAGPLLAQVVILNIVYLIGVTCGHWC